MPTPEPYVPSPARPEPSYGDSHSDPLGRDGPGWHFDPRSCLYVRDKKPPVEPSPWALKKRS